MKLINIALVGCICACAWAVWLSRQKNDNGFRHFVIQSTLLRSDRPVVVLGDSIVEASTLPRTICERPIVNAGVGGTSTADRIDTLIGTSPAKSRPSLVLIALGTNDASQAISAAQFKDNYRALVEKLRPLVDRIAIIGVPSPEAGFENLNKVPDRLVEEYNRVLPVLADEAKVAFIPMPQMPPGHTLDGVHLNASGYDVWESAVSRGVEQLMCHVSKS